MSLRNSRGRDCERPAALRESRFGRAFARREYGIEAEADAGLERILGPASLTAIGLGGLIGAGIFVTVGMAAHDRAGPAIILSFVVAAIACVVVALCFCECASVVPVAGSSYSYAYAAVGEAGAWLSFWNLATCYFLAGSAVAQGWSGYFQSLLGALGVSWPAIVSSAPIDVDSSGQFVSTGSLINLPALLALAVITFVVYRGIRLSLRFNTAILAVKLAVLGTVIVVGLSNANPANWTPFAPFGYGGLALPFGGPATATAGMLAGATIAFFAFGGFEMISTYSQECRNPSRDVSLAVLLTVTIVTVLYIGVAASITGLVPYQQIDVAAPVSEAFRTAGMPWMQILVAVAAVAGMTSVLLVVIMSLPRVLMAVGRDGLLPNSFFGMIDPETRVPGKGVFFVGIVAMALASLLPLRFLMDTVMMATLAGYVSVCAFTLILRRRPRLVEPAFRAPLGPAIPVAGIAVCLLLMFSLPPVNWLRLGVWLAIGLAAYAAYGFRRSITGDLAAPVAAEPTAT